MGTPHVLDCPPGLLMTRTLTCAAILDVSGERGPSRITLDGTSIQTVEPLPPGAAHDDVIIMPTLANAHDHARQVRTSSIGGLDRPLETWLHRLQMYGPVDPYLTVAAPLGRAARGGQGAVMVHYTRPQGLTDYVTEAKEVARAAADVGVRITLAVAMRDRNPLVYGDHADLLAKLSPTSREEVSKRFLAPMMSVADQIARVEETAAAVSSSTVDVQYGPNGVQWSSPELLEAIAEASARTGRRVHMHLLETKYQREWADRYHPRGIARHLKAIGLLSPRLTLAHCVWATDDDLEVIAESGATIATNLSSNLALHSGIAPVAKMLKAGCRVALGIDGQAFDEDDDIVRELRLVWNMHSGWGFDRAMSRGHALEAVHRIGHQTLNSPVTGLVAPGAPADISLFDRALLDEDALLELPSLDLFFSRATARHVKETIVAGRTITRDGVVTGIDLDTIQAELRERLRVGVKSRDAFRCAFPELEAAICEHFTGRVGCC